MSVTVHSKDVGEVRDSITPHCECIKTDEDRIAEYMKRDLGVRG